ncbi:MAG: hypothetical protein ACRCRZ_02985 [Metamycoplasmataceae bacterium]
MNINLKRKFLFAGATVGIFSISAIIISCSNNADVPTKKVEIIPKKISPISVDKARGDKTLLEEKNEEKLSEYFEIKNNNSNTLSSMIKNIAVEITEPTAEAIGNLLITINTTIDSLKIIENKVEIKKIDDGVVVPEEDFEKFKKGGIVNNLNVDKFAKIIQDFKILDNNTIISKISNELIALQMAKISYANNLTLTIKNGSEVTNELFLNLNGSYNGNMIENEEIKISGFSGLSYITNALIYNKFSINKDLFIKNLQDSSTVQNWSEDEWFNYIETFETRDLGFNKAINIKKLKNDKILSDFVFQIQINNISNKVQGNIQINANLNFHKYENNNWNTILTQEPIKFKETTTGKFQIIINESDVFKYLINNTKTTENYNKNIFASNLYTDWKTQNDSLEGNYVTLDENVLNKYLNNSENIVLKTIDMKVDDLNGTIEWEFYIDQNKNDSSEEDQTYSKIQKFEGFKTTKEFDDDKNYNVLFSKNKEDQTDTTFYKNIKIDLAKITNLEIGKEKRMNVEDFQRSFNSLNKKRIYSGIWEENNANNTDPLLILLQYKNLGIEFVGNFNSTISSFDTLLNHFKKSQNHNGLLNGMYVKNIYSYLNDEIIVTKVTENSYKVKTFWSLDFNVNGGIITKKLNLEIDEITL